MRPRRFGRHVAGTGRRAALALVLTACGALPASPPSTTAAAPAPPPRPAGCRTLDPTVEARGGLQRAVDSAAPGAVLCLAPGRYAGPLLLRRRLVLWGPREAVLHSQGEGTTLRVEADGAQVLGFTVDGSGGRFDLLDAAVRVEARDARVEGLRIRNAVFGLLVERSRDVLLRGNEIEGDPEKTLGLRGDAIRLWETRGSRIEYNRVRFGRDVVIWYSPGNRIRGNTVEGGRYGTHFMYSHDNEVVGNRYVGNVVGIFAMYSRDLAIRENLFARSGGAAGIGLGLKESGNLAVTGNFFLANTTGAYLDTSPLYLDQSNRFEANVFRLSETAVVFHSSARRNAFVGNSFRDNQLQVRVEGRGDALGVDWSRNHFDDYAGYDLDGDGLGDVPHELRSLSEDLTARFPKLAFFRGAPALALVELAGHVVPLFEPRTLLRDPEPRMTSLETSGIPRAD